MLGFKNQAKIVSCLLTIAMVFILWPGAAGAANEAVHITGAEIAADNTAITVTFSEGIYTGVVEDRGTGPVTSEDFTLNFQKNAGIAAFDKITALKNSSGEDLNGGEDTVVFHIATTGKAMGVETIEIKPRDGASIYGSDGRAMDANNTTGAKALYDKLPPDFVTDYPKAGATQAFGSKQVEILVKAYENVTAWYVVVASGSGPLTNQQVKDGEAALGAPALASGQNISLTAHKEESIITAALPAGKTNYDAYLIIEDVNNNTMKTPKKVTVTTPDGPVEVSSITVTGAENADTMKSYRDGGSLQMFAEVLPADAANKEVTWSVTGKGKSWFEAAAGEIGAGFAYIDPDTGFMNQGHTVGLVTVKAAAQDGSGVFAEKDITITGVNMSSSISTLAGKTHTLKATPVPALAAGQKLTWASSNEAAVTVDQDGNITAVGLGSADVTGTTPDGRQGIASITVGKSPANYISAFSFPQQTAPASIDGISAVNIGVSEETDISKLTATFTISPKASVTVNGTAQESGVSVNDFTRPVVYKVIAENGDSRDWTVTVSKPYVPVSSITVTGNAGTTSVKKGSTLQMSATVLPANANDKTFTWSVENGTGTAAVSDAGLLTAVKAGTVTVKATANDDADIVATTVITITGSSSPGGGGSSAISKPPAELPEPEIPAVPEPKPREITLNDISGHWAEAAIKSLIISGAINGYPDGSFKPEQTITRAEFAAMLVRVFQLPASNGKIFDDTAGHWAQDAISAAYAAGIISGYNDSSFGSDAPITREQMAVMIASVQGLSAAGTSLDFTDSDKISPWAREGVAAAAAQQLISGYPDKSFQPGKTAARAEAVSILARALSN